MWIACHTHVTHINISISHTWTPRHTHLSHTFDTHTFVTHTFVTHICHTHICHTYLSRTYLSHTYLSHIFVTHISHTHLSHTFVTHVCHTHLSHTHICHAGLNPVKNRPGQVDILKSQLAFQFPIQIHYRTDLSEFLSLSVHAPQARRVRIFWEFSKVRSIVELS